MDTNLIPKVTVLMPVYNAALFLREAIESILSQSFRDFELLIINDGSTDNSIQIIESFSDLRIKVVNNEQNLGVIKSRNKGLVLARGEYIANMDADDISLSSRLEKQVQFLDRHPEVVVLATKLTLIDEEGKGQGYWKDDYNCTTIEQIKQTLPVINCIGQPTVMMRNDIVKKIRYNEKFLHNEDWGLWLNILSNGHVIAKLEETLVNYRIHTNSSTSQANSKGVGEKIIKFKLNYLLDSSKILKFRTTEYSVLLSFVKDLVSYGMPSFYSVLANMYHTSPVQLLKQWKVARDYFSDSAISAGPVFFFPFYHAGGAEKVHASIVEAIGNPNSLILFNGISQGDAFLSAFKKKATVLDVSLLVKFDFAKRWLKKKIETICQKNKNTILFGSNSELFYDFIADIPEDTKAIDLIHAFVHIQEIGAENWSIPVVANLTKRVVIIKKTIEDLRSLYFNKYIPKELLDRVVYIGNFAEERPVIRKNNVGKLIVTYVGRASAEKRIQLISGAAKLAAERRINVEFHFVGEVKAGIPSGDLPYCILHGEVTDPEMLDAAYNRSHLLVMASSREGFPMVIMEAMMHSVVPVVTNVGGISEHVLNNQNGILIEVVTEQDIVEQMVNTISWFDSHRDQLDKMALNAYEYAKLNFNKQFFVNSYRNLFEI